jgi:hypothetical protein
VVENTDAGQPLNHRPKVAFKKRPAGEQAWKADVRLPQLVAGQLPAQVPQHVAAHGAAGGQAAGEAREQLIEDLAAARVQAVQVPAVRHAPAVLADRRQPIPLDHHHPLEPLRQHPGRKQTRHAGAKDHHLVTARVTHPLTPLRQDGRTDEPDASARADITGNPGHA